MFQVFEVTVSFSLGEGEEDLAKGGVNRQRNDHAKEIGIAARRYSQRDQRLGAIPLPESVF